MTVGELIDKLSMMDEDATVVIHDDCDITDVEIQDKQDNIRLYTDCLCGYTL